jgi:hypothetical protein
METALVRPPRARLAPARAGDVVGIELIVRALITGPHG